MKWLLVGLGNPGDQYQSTRHNVGFMVADTIRESLVPSPWSLEKKFHAVCAEANNILVLKPQTFMNRSGEAVAAAARFYKIPADHIIVIHDDLDIALGTVKAGLEKGPKVHHGLASIEQQLGTSQFWRVRVGIEGRTAEERGMWPGEKYVLLPLTAADKDILREAIVLAVHKVETIVKEGL